MGCYNLVNPCLHDFCWNKVRFFIWLKSFPVWLLVWKISLFIKENIIEIWIMGYIVNWLLSVYLRSHNDVHIACIHVWTGDISEIVKQTSTSYELVVRNFIGNSIFNNRNIVWRSSWTKWHSIKHLSVYVDMIIGMEYCLSIRDKHCTR